MVRGTGRASAAYAPQRTAPRGAVDSSWDATRITQTPNLNGDFADDEADYLIEWYSAWQHFDRVKETIAIQPHFQPLSDIWQPGVYLATEDINIVLSSLQAHAAQRCGLNFLVSGMLAIEQVSAEVIPAFCAKTSWISECVYERGSCVVIPFHDVNHFRCFVLEPRDKCCYLFDSLGISSSQTNHMMQELNLVVSSLGWTTAHVGHGFQADGWSCGLWTTLCAMLARQYVSEFDAFTSFGAFLAKFAAWFKCDERRSVHFSQIFLSELACNLANGKDVYSVESRNKLVSDALGLNRGTASQDASCSPVASQRQAACKLPSSTNHEWKDVSGSRQTRKGATTFASSTIVGENRFTCLETACDASPVEAKVKPPEEVILAPALQSDTRKNKSKLAYLDEIFAEIHDKFSSAATKDIVAAAMSDSRCTSNYKQVYSAWQRYKKKSELVAAVEAEPEAATTVRCKVGKSCLRKPASIIKSRKADTCDVAQVIKALQSAGVQRDFPNIGLSLQFLKTCTILGDELSETQLRGVLRKARKQGYECCMSSFKDVPEQLLGVEAALQLSSRACIEKVVEMYHSPEFSMYALPALHAHLEVLRNDVVWTRLHDQELRLFEEERGLTSMPAAEVIAIAKHCPSFISFGKAKIASALEKVRTLRSGESKPRQYVNGGWSSECEEDFQAALRKLRVDLSKRNLETWKQRLSVALNGQISEEDIGERLFDLRREQLKAEGVVFELDEQAELEDAAPDEDLNVQRWGLAQAAAEFAKEKQAGPTFKCGCCGQLQFRGLMKRYTARLHQSLSQVLEIQDKLAYLTAFPALDDRRLLCLSCHECLRQKKKPTFCFGQKLPHNHIPLSVACLTDFEAELCAPRIPFAKISQLRMQKQKQIKGAVINVPADYDTTQRLLPRTNASELKVMIDLKRKLEMKSSYRSGLVRPADIIKACTDLKNTPLYLEVGVEVAEEEAVLASLEEGNDEKSSDEVDKPAPCTEAIAESRIGAHTDEDGFEIVADDEALYDNEEEPADGCPATETFMDFDNDANELRQRVLQVAPGEGKHPLNVLRDEVGEELCFPKLFGGHSRGGYPEIPYFMIARHELRSADRRFASNAANIFYKMRKMHCQTVSSLANMTVRKAIVGKVNAAQLLNPFDKEMLCKHDLGYQSLAQLRTSPDYKAAMKRDLFAMIKQLGKPAWFVTLTSADSRWTELMQMLYLVATGRTLTEAEVMELPSMQKAELIANDPVTCARYFNRRASLFIDGVLLKTNILGSIVDYAGVDEFQTKGSPHVHLILWNPDAPEYEEGGDDAEVVKFISRYITTDVDRVNPKLANLQRHRHTFRCGGHKGKCSFGFPHPPMSETRILRPYEEDELSDEDLETCKTDYVTIKNALKTANVAMREAHKAGRSCAELTCSLDDFLSQQKLTYARYLKALRSSIDRPTIFHKRLLKDNMVNAYNVNMLNIWEANIDVQFILNPHAAAMYVASYIMKGQKGMSNLLRNVASGSFRNSAELVRKTGSTWINSSEISAQEAVYHVLGLRLRRFSRAVQFVNTNLPEKRFRVAMTSEELKKMPADSLNCFKETVREKYGGRKKAELLDLCLADYVALVRWKVGSNQVGEERVEVEFRRQPKVLRWVGYSEKQDFENFCREQIMLFLPWKGVFEDLVVATSWSEIFMREQEQIRDNRERYVKIDAEVWDAICEKAAQECRNAELRNAEAQEGDTFGDKVDLCCEGGELNTSRAVASRGVQSTTHFVEWDHFGDKIGTMNLLQKQFFDHVMYSVRQDSDEPMRLFLTGGAGVGKTLTVHAITQAVTRHYNYDVTVPSDTLRVLLLAPTGKAAFNIAGMTIHSSLGIPPKRENNILPALGSSRLTELQFKFHTVKMVIVDEVSMLGWHLMSHMDRRLRQIMDNPVPFGGLHVIFVGDMFQLAPVQDPRLFSTHNPLVENLWVKYFKMFELQEIMRQKEDKGFAELLNRMREGCTTQADKTVLIERVLPVDSSLPYIFAFNEPKDEHNRKTLQDAAGEEMTFPALDVLGAIPKTEVAKEKALEAIAKKPLSETIGLPFSISLKSGLPVELTSNVNVSDGLCNGSDGKFVAVTGAGSECTLWVEFNSKDVGKQLRSQPAIRALQAQHDLCNDLTPVVLVTKDIRYQTGALHFKRTQFPIVLACGRTVHHAQGSTFVEGGINLCGTKKMGTKKPPYNTGMHYTALSRFTNLSNVRLESFDIEHAVVSESVKTEMARLREDAVLKTTVPCFSSATDCLRLYSHNVRSFRKHLQSIAKCSTLQACSVAFLQETHCEIATVCGEELSILQCVEMPGSRSRPCGIAFVSFKESCVLQEIYRTVISDTCQIEILAVRCRYQNMECCIIGVYQALSAAVAYCSGFDIIAVGDFNVDLDDPRDGHTATLTKHMDKLGLVNVHTLPTRCCGPSRSRIDHIWACSDVAVDANVGYAWYSDHDPLLCQLQVQAGKTVPCSRRSEPTLARGRKHTPEQASLGLPACAPASKRLPQPGGIATEILY